MPQAILIDPFDRGLSAVTVADYDAIRSLFGADAQLEGNTLCRLANSEICLQYWVDCREFLIGPAWRSALAPNISLHGRAVIDAYNRTTGEAADCPISIEEFSRTLEWEDYLNRHDEKRPNQEWVDAISQ